jgi:dTDP-glucose 4,6-dehydratase
MHLLMLVIFQHAFTYAGNLSTIRMIPFDGPTDPNFKYVYGDIRSKNLVFELLKNFDVSAVVHFAAESHVDRSITGPEAFVSTNVLGTQILLECFRQYPAVSRRKSEPGCFVFTCFY